MLDEISTEIDFIFARSKSDLRASLSDALQLIRIAGTRTSDEENLALLVATSMLTLSSACIDVAKLIAKLSSESEVETL